MIMEWSRRHIPVAGEARWEAGVSEAAEGVMVVEATVAVGVE